MPEIFLDNEIVRDNKFDIYLRNGMLRPDYDNPTLWNIHPNVLFPWQYLNFKPEDFWFKIGPFEYQDAISYSNQLDESVENCLLVFSNIRSKGVVL